MMFITALFTILFSLSVGKGQQITRPKLSANFEEKGHSYTWTLEGPSLEAKSFLFGSLHLPYKFLWNQIPAVTKQALNSSDIVVFESRLEDSTQKFKERKLRCAKQLLAKYPWSSSVLLPPKLIGLIENLNKADLNTIFAGLLQNETRNTTETESVNNFLRQLPKLHLIERLEGAIIRRHQKSLGNWQAGGQMVLDSFLAKLALEQNKTIQYIEALEELCDLKPSLQDEHLNYLIASLLDRLTNMVNNQGNSNSTGTNGIALLLRNYLCGRRVESKIKRSENYLEKEINQLNYHDLMIVRNKRWAQRMDRMLKNEPNKTFFFAFGVGHYFGEQNLIELLEEREFQIEEIF